MKKMLVIPMLVICVLVLSACRVHWFDHYYDVPWYVVAVPIVLIIIISHIYIMSGIYICPKCNTEIKPKWYQIHTYIHYNGERVAKCPKCNRIGYCKRK